MRFSCTSVSRCTDVTTQLTTMAAADTLYEVMSLMVKKGPLSIKAAEEQDEL